MTEPDEARFYQVLEVRREKASKLAKAARDADHLADLAFWSGVGQALTNISVTQDPPAGRPGLLSARRKCLDGFWTMRERQREIQQGRGTPAQPDEDAFIKGMLRTYATLEIALERHGVKVPEATDGS
jgi:hypothetical protein